MSGDGCGDCRGYRGEDCAVNRHAANPKMCIMEKGKNYGIYKDERHR